MRTAPVQCAVIRKAATLRDGPTASGHRRTSKFPTLSLKSTLPVLFYRLKIGCSAIWEKPGAPLGTPGTVSHRKVELVPSPHCQPHQANT